VVSKGGVQCYVICKVFNYAASLIYQGGVTVTNGIITACNAPHFTYTRACHPSGGGQVLTGGVFFAGVEGFRPENRDKKISAVVMSFVKHCLKNNSRFAWALTGIAKCV